MTKSKKPAMPKISPRALSKTPPNPRSTKTRKYSDSRERILNNLQKMQRSCKLIRSRFVVWSRAMPNDQIVSKMSRHLGVLNEMDATLREMHEELHDLLDGFNPLKMSFKPVFEIGDAVSLSPDHKERYERVYTANFDELEIESITEHEHHIDYTVTDGEIRFLVPAKSHLIRRSV